MFIAFLGCDGSGKSAVIAGVTGRLEERGVAVIRGHWRPAMNAAGGGGGAAANDPHGQKPRGCIGSILKLKWLWLNWWVGWFRFLRSDAASGAVLFDRYHADLLVDPRRYRYGAPLWLARLASRWMPQPDIVIYLDAPSEVLLSRKQEVPREALERSRAAYLELATSHPRFRIIDASQSLESVINEVYVMIDPIQG
jgi:thymidylate kinase